MLTPQSFAVAAVIVISASGSGCARRHRDLIRDGTLRCDMTQGDTELLASVHAHQEGPTLIVSGSVKRTPTPQQVDVALFAPDGDLLGQVRARMSPSRHKRFHHPVRFNARFDTVPPPGSTLRLKRHAGSDGAG